MASTTVINTSIPMRSAEEDGVAGATAPRVAASGSGSTSENRSSPERASEALQNVAGGWFPRRDAANAASALLTTARDAIVASVVIGGGSLLFASLLLYAALLSRIE